MSSLGFVLLCHAGLHRAEAVARHLAEAGCPMVIHVDAKVPRTRFDAFRAALSPHGDIRFSRRMRCEWGTFSLVRAMQEASAQMLEAFPQVRHVYAVSGSCLPLRPVAELRAFLDARPRTDFIESVTTEDVPWTVGGLSEERFTLCFPFSWQRHRWLFDRWVEVQRRLGLRRSMPEGLVPHLGSQWWCLTRQTLSAILEDPNRQVHDRFFARVWIPDESYFQTLARRWSTDIESRSLTLSKFDFRGKPHLFYDDHLQLLRRSDCFFARKIWPEADRLYSHFLAPAAEARPMAVPNPGRIDRLFARATERRTRGRAGLYMQSRFPNLWWENGRTAGAYSVFHGFADLFDDFEGWLTRSTGLQVHGHLFAPDRVRFAGGGSVVRGALSDSAALRDYNPEAFLTNLIWNTRGERQCFQFGPGDVQTIAGFLAGDPNAQISIISGAWMIPLFRRNARFSDVRREAAALQRVETAHLELMRARWVKARVRIWTLAEVVAAPMGPVLLLLDEIAPRAQGRPAEAPRMVDLTGFGKFLQNLRNQGMKPTLTGDFPAEEEPDGADRPRGRPYLVR
jgi:hypothetical protein